MAFVKGTPKPAGSGRKKGQSARATVTAILEQFHCDPIEGMIRIAQDKKAKLELRGRLYAELAQYRWPKLRAMEISGPEGAAVQMSGDVRVIFDYDEKPVPNERDTPETGEPASGTS
jgi:hypothetical protein